MASVLTNNRLVRGQVAQVVGVSAVAKIPQLVAGQGRTGNASVLIPDPRVYSDGLNVRRYRYTALFEATTTATENLTFQVFLSDTAGTATSIATSGALALNTASGLFFLEVEFILDANTGFGATTGKFSGYGPTTLIAAATISAKPVVVFTGTANLQIYPNVTSSATDAAAVVNVVETTLELL